MKVYSPPAEVHVPDFSEALTNDRYDRDKDDRIHSAFFAELKAKLQEMGFTGPLTGEIVRFPVGDGYAQYMVAEATTETALVHLPIHDAWSIPEAHARGLRKADIKELVERGRRLSELFGRKKESA